MRNLKRVLSMALASVMVLGLTVVGASAANFNDQAEIENTTAAAVMSAIGVLEGNEKGDFMPDGILTREQAAKIICYMLMGPENAEKLGVSGTKFSDVAADRWSAPYIAYCANMGILAGDGTGKFNPEGELTGHAFAKMLLVALGYDATIQNYVGDTWAINVATDAVNTGVFVEGTVLSDALTRDNAAQMAFQTLSADMVEYESKGGNISIGGADISLGASSAKPTGKTFAEQYFADLKSKDDSDALGRPATTWEYDKDTVVTEAKKADYSVVVTEKGKDTAYWANEAKKNLKLDSGNVVVVNGADADSVSNVGSLKIGDTVEFFNVDTEGDKDAAMELAVVTRYDVYTIDEVRDCDPDVSADKKAMEDDGAKYVIALSNNKEYYDTEFAGFGANDYVEDAYVAVIEKGDEIVDSYLPETIEGKVTATGSDYIRVDGTKYTVREGVTATLDSEYTFVVDKNGYIIATEVIKESAVDLSEVYYVVTEPYKTHDTKYGQTTYTVNTQVVAMDGTVSEIALYRWVEKSQPTDNGQYDDGVDKLEGTKAEVNAGDFITIETNDDYDDLYDVTAAEDSIDSDYTISNDLNVTGNNKLEANSSKIGNVRLTSDTQYVIVEGSGSNLKVKTATGGINYTFDGKEDTYAITKKVTGNDVAVYIVLVTDEYKSTSTTYENVVFVDKNADYETTKVDGKDRYTFAVIDENGKEMVVTAAEKPSALTDGFYTYEIDDNDVYTFAGNAVKDLTLTSTYDDQTGDVASTFKSYFGDLLTLDKQYFVDIDTSSAKFVDLHDKDVYSKSLTTLAAMNDAKKAGWTVDLSVYLDDGAVLVVVTGVTAAED